MTDFMLVAALYYACDQAANEARLSASDIIRCSVAYEALKVHFLSEEERLTLSGLGGRDHAVTMQVAYRRFKAWEEEHPHLVDALKAGETPAVY